MGCSRVVFPSWGNPDSNSECHRFKHEQSLHHEPKSQQALQPVGNPWWTPTKDVCSNNASHGGQHVESMIIWFEPCHPAMIVRQTEHSCSARYHQSPFVLPSSIPCEDVLTMEQGPTPQRWLSTVTHVWLWFCVWGWCSGYVSKGRPRMAGCLLAPTDSVPKRCDGKCRVPSPRSAFTTEPGHRKKGGTGRDIYGKIRVSKQKSLAPLPFKPVEHWQWNRKTADPCSTGGVEWGPKIGFRHDFALPWAFRV